MPMPHSASKNIQATILGVIFTVLTVWWIVLFFGYNHSLGHANLIWAASYQIISILGGIWGIRVGMKWGGFKSVMGRAIMFFSLGLLFQSFGQSVFSYYNLFGQVAVPYPSIADIGFFGSIPMYILGGFHLAHASGVTLSLRSFGNKFRAILIPGIILVASYFFFLSGYTIETKSYLQVFLDFGYPLGQAIYVAIVLLTFFLTRNVLGGVMRNKVWFILIALAVQYLADYNFLYQAMNGTWINGGYGDFIYLFAYLLMAYGLIKLGALFNNHTENLEN